MNSLIYYPLFEPNNQKWLKACLLYLEEINPVIPELGDFYLSDDYNKILSETDFYRPHRPSKPEATRASLAAVRELTPVINNHLHYVEIFNSPNIVREWREGEKDIVLFEDKYENAFQKFCEQNQLCEEHGLGIRINNSLSHIYMTIFSNEIAYQRGGSTITDNELYDEFSLYLKSKDMETEKEINTAQTFLDLAIPEGLEQVSLDDIITLRNDYEFNNMVKALRQTLEDYEDHLVNERKIKELIGKIKEINTGITAKIVETGLHAIQLGLKLLHGSPDEGVMEYIDEAITGTRISIKAKSAVKQFKTSKERDKVCKQYLLELEKL